MKIKNEEFKKYFLLFFYSVILIIFPVSLSFAGINDLTNILKPQIGYNPRKLIFFTDHSGVNNVAYQYENINTPNQIFFIRSHNETWSAPIYLNLESWSNVYLCDVKNLNDNTPLMLLIGDDTDYSRIFDVSDLDSGDDIPAKLGLSEKEFFYMLSSNQRVFVSFMLNGQWEKPIAVPGTYGASKAIMAAGKDGSVLVLFYKDVDKKLETVEDVDIYATVYNNGTWSKINRLTDNEVIDYEARVTFVRDEYLIVWVSDEDNDVQTGDDKLLNYAVVGTDGKSVVSSTTIMNEFQTNPIPILGNYNNKAVLMWSSDPLSGDDPRRPIREMQYEHGWLPPRNTGLLNYTMGGGTLHEIGESLVLIYRESGALQAAVNTGEEWFSSGMLTNFNLLSLDASTAAYAPDTNGDLYIGLTGFIPAREKDYDNEFDGIYYKKLSIKPDLAIYDVEASPRKKKIGQDIELSFKAYNSGYLKSKKYTVLIKQDKQVLKTFEGAGLSAGEEQDYEFQVTLDKATMLFEIEIIAEFEERDKDNNTELLTVKVMPDYNVRSVTRNAENEIIARVIEEKGIAAPTVPVDFYAVINGKSEKIGNSAYDPIADEPVKIEWQNLGSISEPFQLIAEVNHERVIREDNYSNNKGSYIHNPLPDFVVDNFSTSKDSISVTLKNIGEKEVQGIDILITDDPEVVAAHGINEIFGDLHYYQEVELNENQTANITINHDQMDELKDKRIYAIVNPAGNTVESNQNNNLVTAMVKLHDKIPPVKSRLIFGSVYGFGSDIIITLVNTGNNPELTPRVELINDKGIIVSQQIVPVVKAHGWKKVVSKNIKPGKYTVRLTTNWMGNIPRILEISVTL